MTGKLALALLLAAAIGLLLGLMGSGGSIVTLPVLVYVAGIPARTAVSMTMVGVGAAPIDIPFYLLLLLNTPRTSQFREAVRPHFCRQIFMALPGF